MKKILKKVWGYIKRLDLLLLLLSIIAGAAGTFILYSLYQNDVSHVVVPRHYQMQLLTTIAGIAAMLVIAGINYRFISKLWFIYAPVTLIMTLLLFTSLGITAEGTDDTAWLDLGFTTIQPSEFMKIAFILTFATHIAKVGNQLNKLPNLLLLILHGMVPVALVSLQGDDGTALVFLFMFVIMLFAAGLWWRYILIGVAVVPIGIYIAWNYIMQSHHKIRFQVLFDPAIQATSELYDQQRASLIAIGTGGMSGQGLFGGDYYYVPAIHTDFIFSYIGMALGFMGCLAIIGLFLFILIKILHIAFVARDMLGRQICIGAFAMIMFHCIINIGMAVAAVPVIGIPLPFFSAGGTSNVSTYIAIGLALSVYAHREKQHHMFYTED